MLFTTSDNFTDQEIESYYGLVDSHIVVGANLFRDVFAGFRDIFGGETKGYKKDIAKLKQAALQELESKSKKIGANAIIAIKVDLDEFSGGGKSMFMYNISGTAVKLKKDHSSDTNVERKNGDIRTLELDELEEIKEKIRISEKIIKDDQLEYDVEKVSNNNLWDDVFYDKYLELFFSGEKNPRDFYKYIREIPIKKYSSRFFGEFNSLDPQRFYHINVALEEQNWYDTEKIVKLLSSEDHVTRFRALKLVVLERKYYSKELIDGYKKIYNYLKEHFKEEVDSLREEEKRITENKFFYKCPNCLQEREYREDLLCTRCQTNYLGFTKDFFVDNFLDIVEYLRLNIKALQRI